MARERGEVIPFGHSPEGVFSFMIRTPAALILVRVQYVTILHAPVAAVEKEHCGLIGILQSRSGPAPAELWLYNKHGSYRYFRIRGAGLVELDRYGNAPAAGGPGPGEPAGGGKGGT